MNQFIVRGERRYIDFGTKGKQKKKSILRKKRRKYAVDNKIKCKKKSHEKKGLKSLV